MNESSRTTWSSLLSICLSATSATPTGKWLKSVDPLVESIGDEAFKKYVIKWFPLVDKSRTTRIENWSTWAADPNDLINPINADILKGLVWICARWDDADLARALAQLAASAYRKVPQQGPRCVRVGNACVWALGEMPGESALGQLARLKLKIKFGTAQKGVATALAKSAARLGMSPDEIDELSVPTYGLTEVGVRREQFGEFTAELRITGTATAELGWINDKGKRQSSVPKAVKEEFAEGAKELAQALKDVRSMLPAQRDRIDGLYLEERRWPFEKWRERYNDHPLVGTLARRLIWRFSDGDRSATGIWHDEAIVSHGDLPIEWLAETTEVMLWHPIDSTTEEVLAWRDWLTRNEVRQPFRQAHREMYLLTDAERATSTYSNRFAAHIIRQHQFNALCGVHGWKNTLRLMVDDEFPPATRTLPHWNLRAEFWIEGAGDNPDTDITGAGTFLYLATDQVRFYRMNARENRAHAGGGGYYIPRDANATTDEHQPLPLEEIPPIVFSEVMRDVDLFVGVASVGNDPNWTDGGGANRYVDYWNSYSFGEISETGKTRRQVLEKLLPRLKIAERCHLAERFLVVRGDIRTYKIHLGSGNILMEPNDQYLCIVAAQSGAARSSGEVFLPFEGDSTLSIILSKAFLLSSDTTITDPTIVTQIRG